MSSYNILCTYCGTVYGQGRDKCPSCYGTTCYECGKPVYRWEDWHKDAHGSLHGRCVNGPQDPEPKPVEPDEAVVTTVILVPAYQEVEI